MPAVDWELTGDQGSAAAVAFFGDLEQVMTLFGTEGFEAPVVEDEELDAAERAHQSRIPSVTMGQRQIGEEPRDTLVEDGPVVAARLVAEGTSKPRFADTGRPFDDQVLRYVDPVAMGELLEQAAIEAARRPVIDVLDRRLMAQAGEA